ncbi:unnamed protein product [Symbiodinium sp. CCMP2592]|nr:unnamed protein product [Symbiodinium sp. CCMP2592]
MARELSSKGTVPGEAEVSEVFVIGRAFSGNDGALEAIDGSFEWIEFDTGDPQQDEELRNMRLEAARLTAAACRLGRYSFNEADVPLVNLPETLEGTHVVLNVDGTTQQEETFETEFVFHEAEDSSLTEVLLGLAAERSVTVLNAGSPYKIGGNFVEGGAVEFEEMLCMQSTLQMSLRRASKMAAEHGVRASKHARPVNGTSWDVHIPEYGAVLSPNVEIFRAGPEVGFPFLENPLLLASVITMAMPNCNQDLDEPCDVPDSAEEYQRHLFAKIACSLELAMAIRSRTLVVPALGCGRYLNDPSTVGKVLCEVFQSRFMTAFQEVHFFGEEDFLLACSSLQRETSLPELEQLGAHARERRNAAAWLQDDPLMFAPELGESETILDSEPQTQLDLGELPKGRPRQRPSALDGLSDLGLSAGSAGSAQNISFQGLEEPLEPRFGSVSASGSASGSGRASRHGPSPPRAQVDERSFQSLKSTVGKVSNQHIRSLETLQTSLSELISERNVREQLDALRHEALAIQDQSAVIQAQRLELEERGAELAASREELLTQLEHARKMAGGCRMS